MEHVARSFCIVCCIKNQRLQFGHGTRAKGLYTEKQEKSLGRLASKVMQGERNWEESEER